MAETTTEKSRDQQINDLATRVAQEFKTVKNNTVSVNTQTLTDAQKTQVKTNLGITDVNTSTLVPKTGNRGVLAGYETPASASSIDGTSNDANYSGANVTVANGVSGTSWTKTVLLTDAVTVTLGSSWSWVGGEAPTISANSLLVLHWCSTVGIANVISPTA